MKKNIVKKILISTMILINILVMPRALANNETSNETNNEVDNGNTSSSNTTNTSSPENNTNTSNEGNQIDTPNQNTTTTPDTTYTEETPKNTSTTNNKRENNVNTNKESSNANLSNLGIRPNDFSGFTPNKTSYEVTVPEDVEEVEVYAQAQDSNATIEGTGDVELKEGENEIEVIVTAEDGTTKTYTIKIIRGSVENTTENNNSSNEGLTELKISNVTIEPEFKTSVYEYKVKYIGEETQLQIEAKPTDENFNIEILGNENLQEGENLITILVTDSDGNNIATYQLIVNKSLVDVEALAREEQQRNMIIAGAIVAVIVIVAIIVIIVKKRRSRVYVEDYIPSYDGIDDNDEEEMPKSLRNMKNDQIYDFDNNDEPVDILEEINKSKTRKYDEQETEKMKKELLNTASFENDSSSNCNTQVRRKGKRYR